MKSSVTFKTVSSVLSSVVLVSLLAACGSNSTYEPSASSPSSNAPKASEQASKQQRKG
ncbi:hypothetical protein [Paenibacillus alba]|uniref:ABC transporter substrate-binding protein n=1 Tax=Paenibacillus alba TaxID=1197127 RepID=A0ABU6FX37_9BACL|nr:hypothetical protein [Paenibacillus alba]MEC0226473.1 hypothetical protein [Paenibacillus alba]